MSDPKFCNGLTDATANNSSISLSIRDDLGMIDLRGDLSNKKFATIVKKTMGFALPVEPRQSTNKGGRTALWLSPDQWLILCPRNEAKNVSTDLRNELNNIHSLVVDVSDARTIIRLKGSGSKEVLMKGAPVDLKAQDCTKGFVRRLRFAEMAAMIHVVSSDPEIIDLFVFRSYGQHAWDWLAATSSKQSKMVVFERQKPAPV